MRPHHRGRILDELRAAASLYPWAGPRLEVHDWGVSLAALSPHLVVVEGVSWSWLEDAVDPTTWVHSALSGTVLAAAC